MEAAPSGPTEVTFQRAFLEPGDHSISVGPLTSGVEVVNELTEEMKATYAEVDPVKLEATPQEWYGRQVRFYGQVSLTTHYKTYSYFTFVAETPGASSSAIVAVITDRPASTLARGMFVRVYGIGREAPYSIPEVSGHYVVVEPAAAPGP